MNDAPAPANDLRLPPAWIWVVASGLLAHFLVPITDHVVWDGWWYAADLGRAEGPTTMARLFQEVGRHRGLDRVGRLHRHGAAETRPPA